MSRLHILANKQCALHEPVPAGNNAAGVPWRTALINSGMGGTSVMTVGNGAGQISSAEMAQIASGELREVVFTFENNPAWTAAQRNAAMDAQIDNVSRETQTDMVQSLRMFGATRG